MAKRIGRRISLSLAAIAFAACLPAGIAHAAAAPSMYGVKEILVQYPRLDNPEAATFCGLAHMDMLASLIKDLKTYAAPVFPPLEAMPPQAGIARIELWPEIYTLNNEGIDCTSWVSLTARTDNNVRISPVDTPRNVTVDYWQKGILVTSTESQHMRSVTGALMKLGEDFAGRFGADQPTAHIAPMDKK